MESKIYLLRAAPNTATKPRLGGIVGQPRDNPDLTAKDIVPPDKADTQNAIQPFFETKQPEISLHLNGTSGMDAVRGDGN